MTKKSLNFHSAVVDQMGISLNPIQFFPMSNLFYHGTLPTLGYGEHHSKLECRNFKKEEIRDNVAFNFMMRPQRLSLWKNKQFPVQTAEGRAGRDV